MGVRGHQHSGGVRLRHDHRHLVGGELCPHHIGARRGHASTGHHLDDIDLPLGALADRGRDGVRAIDHTAHVIAMTRRFGQRRSRGQDGRFGCGAIVGPLAVAPVHDGVSAITEVTDGGDARGQLALQAFGDHPIDLVIAEPGHPVECAGSAVANEVDVGVDESRQNGRVAIADDLPLLAQAWKPRFDGDDPVLLDQHRGRARTERLAVEQPRALNRDHALFVLSLPQTVKMRSDAMPAIRQPSSQRDSARPWSRGPWPTMLTKDHGLVRVAGRPGHSSGADHMLPGEGVTRWGVIG